VAPEHNPGAFIRLTGQIQFAECHVLVESCLTILPYFALVEPLQPLLHESLVTLGWAALDSSLGAPSPGGSEIFGHGSS